MAKEHLTFSTIGKSTIFKDYYCSICQDQIGQNQHFQN